MNSEQTRAMEALQAIPADLPREEWVKAGMAAQAAGLDFDTFDAWSAQADSYDARAARDTWRSFEPGKGVGAGTLYRMAAEHGWRMGSKPAAKPVQTRQKPAQAPRKPAPNATPSAVWNRAKAATWEHGYISAKGASGAPLDSLRVLPDGDSLRIAGQSMAGALVVPAFGPDGELQSLQLIPPPGAGKKMNLPECPMAGASFTVGEVQSGAPVYLAEGIGAAWACWTATGHAAVVCFGWGNVGKVAAQLRKKDEAARLVLVPDVGKEEAAAKVAREHGCMVAEMPEGWDNNSDVNDLAQRDGHDVLADMLANAKAPAQSPTEQEQEGPHLVPVNVADVLTNPSPPPRFVWDGYCPRGTVTLFGAHGGTGKSTVALMLAVSAALGRPLFGVDVEPCAVVFASLEDGAGIVRHRLASICRAWGINPQMLQDRLHIVDGTERPELFQSETRDAGKTTASYAELHELVQSTGAGLVIIDNASDAYGGDEIQRRQVRAFMRALAEVARANDAAVMLLAHVDKVTSRARKAEGGEGYSGSTAWHNSARSRLFMSRAEDGTLTIEHQKSNLGKLREPLALEWPDGGLPELQQALDPEVVERLQGRADDASAVVILRLIAEFEERGHYCGIAMNARNNPHVMLKSEPSYLALKLRTDDTRRIVNQCQRAGWLEIVHYRTTDRKDKDRWTVTKLGRDFAGIAPSAPSAPCYEFGEESAEGARGAPCAPCPLGGVGETTRAQEGAEMDVGGGNHG